MNFKFKEKIVPRLQDLIDLDRMQQLIKGCGKMKKKFNIYLLCLMCSYQDALIHL